MSKEKKSSHLIPIFIYILVGILSIVFLLVVLWLFLFDKMYPGIKIAGVDISLLNLSQAKTKVDQMVKNRLNQNLKFTYSENGQNYSFILSPDDVIIDYQSSLTESFALGHQKIYFRPHQANVNITFKPSFDYKLQAISSEINQPPIDSQIKVDGEQIIVTPSQEGKEIDHHQLKNQITAFLNGLDNPDTTIKTKSAPPKLSYETAIKIKKRLDEIKLEPLKLIFKDKIYTLTINDLVNLIDLQSSEPTLASVNIGNEPTKITDIEIGNQTLTDTNLTLNTQKVSNLLVYLSAKKE